ncbi:MAG: type II toxin-antitoxin system VapC family toxin [Verrucomicrobia bacterium]|nr:type II toxin-antitoxin system VapC family toxin [Verrucomicrobiota bacterium]
MRAYADTSFLVKLLTQEPGTRAAVADYRRLGRPPVFFLPLHDLEVANAIRQRAFHQRNTTPSAVRSAINRERDTSLALLQKYISRRAFIEISQDMDTSIELARKLSVKHTECLGCRGFDLLHVASAVDLECEVFLTSDRIQGALARAEGLEVTASADE